ncbi:hypothetical protein BJ165DRAFT_1580868 [Panaeolus papilionaceus]|nr:hypothetical protein BJ165DRAFT_1580868 [Panaeolus papilionaceus]
MGPGRPILYKSPEERKQAKRQQNDKYAASSRGRAQRAKQNHQAYEQRKGFKVVLLRHPRIPMLAQELGTAYVDVQEGSVFFNKYFLSAMSVAQDRHEFLHWDQPPPYAVSRYLIKIGLDDTIDALHGYRAWAARDEESQVVTRIQTGEDHMVVWQDVHDKLSSLLREFKELKIVVSKYKKGTLDHIMGMHLLQWKSRSILAYDNFWMAFKYGSIADIEDSFHSRWKDW